MTLDVSATIAPKSDQLNSDDLITGPRTIKITRVKAGASPEQPIDIHFEGDDNKPYKPCKSMRRVLVHVWGKDGQAYVGRSMTIYRDEKVRFGGVDVGGIRISHMSDIPSDITLALTASKQSRKPFTVKPLKVTPVSAKDEADAARNEAMQAVRNLLGVKFDNKEDREKFLNGRESAKMSTAELVELQKDLAAI